MAAGFTYRIKIREQLDESWSAQLSNLSILSDPQTNGTIITGVVQDDAALRGLLNQIFNFNLHLVGLERVEQPPNQEI
jgi:hypothetical protein